MAEFSLFLIELIVDYGLQLVFGILSIVLKTEKFYDFIGSATFISCSLIGLFYDWNKSSKISIEAKVVQALCICCWAAKLGSFLLYRVIKSGGDARFDDAKKNPCKLLFYWMLQGSWVYLNILPSLFLFTTAEDSEVHFISLIGWSIFAFGLIFETVADYQKTAFRNKPENKGRFITSGLWSISRHPNYFGEIVLWYGLFVSAAPLFTSQWAYFTILCPTATAFQICFLSGIPLLEKSGLERWGSEREYAAYVHSTGVLIPWLVCCECTPLPSTDLLVERDELEHEQRRENADGKVMVDIDLEEEN